MSDTHTGDIHANGYTIDETIKLESTTSSDDGIHANAFVNEALAAHLRDVLEKREDAKVDRFEVVRPCCREGINEVFLGHLALLYSSYQTKCL
jgi:hypothetical protein